MAEGSVVKAGAQALRGSLATAHARPPVAQPCGGQRSTLLPDAASRRSHFLPRQRVDD